MRLLGADVEARRDVPGRGRDERDLELAVGGVGSVAPQVRVDAARPRRDAQRAQRGGRVRADDAGPVKAGS